MGLFGQSSEGECELGGDRVVKWRRKLQGKETLPTTYSLRIKYIRFCHLSLLFLRFNKDKKIKRSHSFTKMKNITTSYH